MFEYPQFMVAVVASLIAVLLFPPAVADDGCADALVIGVAGSGQRGFGDQVEAVVDEIEAQASDAVLNVDSTPLDYPAVSVSDSFGLVLFTGEYTESVEVGADVLRTILDDSISECPRTDLVLIGYSQGAEVIKQALADGAVRYPVASIVLLADPTRDPSQTGVIRLGDPTGERGGVFGSVSVPDAVRPVVIDVCAEGDGVCERGRFGIGAHVFGYDDTPAEVAPLVVARLDTHLTTVVRPR